MLSDVLKKRFDDEIKANPVVLYMKGNALFPRCGFSAAALQILQGYGPVHTVDVLADPELRDGIKEYSSWPTIPAGLHPRRVRRRVGHRPRPRGEGRAREADQGLSRSAALRLAGWPTPPAPVGSRG